MDILIKCFTFLCCFMLLGTSLAPVSAATIYIIIRPLLQPFSFLQYNLFSIPIGAFPSILLVLIALLNTAFRRKHRFFIGHIVLLYILFMFVVLSCYNSSSQIDSLGAVSKIFVGIGMFLLVYNGIDDMKKIRLLLWGFSISTIIPILFGFYEVFTGNYGVLHQTNIDRVSSVFGIGNAFGIYMSIAMVAILMLFLLEKTNNKRKILLILMGCLIVLQVLALNRGTWIALFLGTVIASIFFKQKIQIRWFVLTGILVLIFFSGHIVNRFYTINYVDESGRSHNTFHGRIEYWKAILPLIAKKPIIGYGVGTSEEVTAKYLQKDNPPHNDYLRLALDVGIPGALTYMLFLFFELIRNLKMALLKEKWQVNFPMLILIIYFIIISMTQNIVYNVTNFPMFMAMVGLSWKYNKIMTKGFVCDHGQA